MPFNSQLAMWAFVVIASAIGSHGTLAAADRYWAMLRNGEQVNGDQLQGWTKDRSAAKLDNKPLFSDRNPVRLLCDNSVRFELRPPYVVLANGDILPGEVVGASNLAGHTPTLRVKLSKGLMLGRGDANLLVRSSAVVRIVRHGGLASTAEQTRLILENGEQFQTRSIRWAEDGLRFLTAAGPGRCRFDEIAGAGLRAGYSIDALLEDTFWPRGSGDRLIKRVLMANGAQLTTPWLETAVIEEVRQRKVTTLAIQPTWASAPIYLHPDDVFTYSFRQPDELPLSLMPADELASESGIFHLGWRRNLSAAGSALRSGPLSSDLGVGTHSSSQVAFDLPALAKSFSAWIGLDRSAGKGGCVRCRIRADGINGKILWESAMLNGEMTPSRIGPIDVHDAKRLVLETGFGDEGRPPGADPLDIRDYVDWLMPLVTIDLAGHSPKREELHRWYPQLAGWTMPASPNTAAAIVPYWNSKTNRWSLATRSQRDDGIIEFRQKTKVTLRNAWLPLTVSRDGVGKTNYDVSVQIDDKIVPTTMNGNIKTRKSLSPESRVVKLVDYIGQEVELALIAKPTGKPGSDRTGLIWLAAKTVPLIDDLPSIGEPITPAVPITSLTPLSTNIRGKDVILRRGQLTDGRPLSIHGHRLQHGFGMPTGSEISFSLDPTWRRFVAVLGLADGWQGAGPYQLLLDDEVHWQSTEPSVFARNDPARQISINIPPGHNTITLRIHGRECFGAWGYAGFFSER